MFLSITNLWYERAMAEKQHLYNSRLGKVRWFVRRFGARELVMKPLRTVFAPAFISSLPARTFSFHGRQLPYLLHRYNMTWASERCVEVPIARQFLESSPKSNVIEVGNVLSHYGPIAHDVLDKFETGAGVINEDVVAFTPRKHYDLVISISTFEHIGFDDESAGSSSEKIQSAIASCKKWLSPDGMLVFTAPIGYNPELDALLKQSTLGLRRETYLKKHGTLDWRECEKTEALSCSYKKPFPYANAIVVAELGG